MYALPMGSREIAGLAFPGIVYLPGDMIDMQYSHYGIFLKENYCPVVCLKASSQHFKEIKHYI